MRIIKQGTAYPIRVRCPVCQTELEVDQYDWQPRLYNTGNCVVCPICNNSITADDAIDDEPEFETYKYPDDFTDYSVGKDLSDDWINSMIREGVNYLKNNPDEIVWYTATGNTFIIIFSYSEDEEYCVSVAKNYKEVHIPYGQEGNL